MRWSRVRTIIGPTDSKKADKGTVRGDLGEDAMANIVHASDSLENAEIELERFFEPEELFSYEMSYKARPQLTDSCGFISTRRTFAPLRSLVRPSARKRLLVGYTDRCADGAFA